MSAMASLLLCVEMGIKIVAFAASDNQREVPPGHGARYGLKKGLKNAGCRWTSLDVSGRVPDAKKEPKLLFLHSMDLH